MPSRLTDLLLDELEIVEQPRLCRYNPSSRPDYSFHHVIRRQQNAHIVRQSWQQPVRPRTRIDAMLASQRYRVTLQLLDAEQHRAQQQSILLVPQRIACA
jgi:hypothetical protein